MKYLLLFLCVSVSFASCSKEPNYSEQPFYIQYTLNGETTKAAGFVGLSPYNWDFGPTEQSVCNVDSCLLISQAFFTNEDQGSMLVFALYKEHSTGQFADSSGFLSVASLEDFVSGVAVGRFPFCDGNTYPCISILITDNGGTQWSTNIIPTGELPINSNGAYYFQFDKINSYNVGEVPDDMGLRSQVMVFGKGRHLIYFDATYEAILYNNDGEAKHFKNARVRTMLLN